MPAVLAGPPPIGDAVFAVGNPLGLQRSLTAGVVSAVDRSDHRAARPGARWPDPVRRGGQPRQQRRAAAQPGGSGGRHRHRPGQPGQPGLLRRDRVRRPDRDRRRRGRRAPAVATRIRRRGTGRRDGPRQRRPGCPSRPRSTRSRRRSWARTGCWSGCSSRCWPAGTCSSRASPGSPRRWRSRPSPQAIGGQFQRIQFTSDLVPADVVGTRIYNQRDGRVPGLARAGLHQPPARRRDQPRPGEGAERAAGGDAGAAGDDRARDVPGAGPVPGDGDAEPDRVGGHLPAAGGAARPVHVQGAGRLPHGDAGVRRRRADDHGARVAGAGDRHRDPARLPARRGRRVRRPADHRVRRAAEHRDPRPGRGRLAGPRPVRDVRGQPAGVDQHGARRQGARVPARPRLRAARGRPRAGPGRAAPPRRPVLRGPRRRRLARRRARPAAGRDPAARARSARARPAGLDQAGLDQPGRGASARRS